MAETWELCVLVGGEGNVVAFHSKAESKVYSIKEFKKKFEVDPIQYILANGWEPFSIISSAFYFRRKVNS